MASSLFSSVNYGMCFYFQIDFLGWKFRRVNKYLQENMFLFTMFYRVYNFLSKSCRKRIKFIMVSYWTGKKSMVSQNLCFMFLGCFLITSESHPLKFLLDNKGRMHGYSGSFCNRERLWFMEKRGRNNWKILWYGIRLDRLKQYRWNNV